MKKNEIPTNSLTCQYLPVDYYDVFCCEYESEATPSTDDIMVSFWTDMPGWVGFLFKIRNFLVRFVGLKGSERKDYQKLEHCIRTGEPYGFTSVPAKNDNETVLLLSDKHLDAYLSVHLERTGKVNKVSLITLVEFHNKLGNVYFGIISPFHKVIVNNMLKRSIRKFRRDNQQRNEKQNRERTGG